MKKEFEKFMKERGAWDEFVELTCECWCGYNIDQYLNIGPPEANVSGAFGWKYAGDKWGNIDKEWRNHLKTLKQ